MSEQQRCCFVPKVAFCGAGWLDGANPNPRLCYLLSASLLKIIENAAYRSRKKKKQRRLFYSDQENTLVFVPISYHSSAAAGRGKFISSSADEERHKHPSFFLKKKQKLFFAPFAFSHANTNLTTSEQTEKSQKFFLTLNDINSPHVTEASVKLSAAWSGWGSVSNSHQSCSLFILLFLKKKSSYKVSKKRHETQVYPATRERQDMKRKETENQETIIYSLWLSTWTWMN